MDLELLFVQANCHVQSGDLEAARTIYRQILDAHPDNVRALHALGVVEFRLGSPDRAIECIERALTYDQEYAAAWHSLGLICEQCGMISEAREAFARAAGREFDSPGRPCDPSVSETDDAPGKVTLDELKQSAIHREYQYDFESKIVEGAVVDQSPASDRIHLDSSVTIGVAAYGNWKGTLETLRSIFKSADGDFELILVDDCSPDETLVLYRQVMTERPATRVFHFPQNLEYSHSVNAILSHARGDLVLFLSNDIIVTPAYLSELICVAQSTPDIGLVRGVSNYVDNGLSSHQVFFYGDPERYEDVHRRGAEVYEQHQGEVLDDPFLTGDAFMVTRRLIQEIGTFDTRFVGYFSDHDFGLRARIAGFKTVLARGAFAFHNHGANVTTLAPEQQSAKVAARNRRISVAWREFKHKYELPYYRPFMTILTSIPWEQLASVEYGHERQYISPQDYSPFEMTLPQGAKAADRPAQAEFDITILFEQASALVGDNQFQSAGELYRMILQYDPDNPRALHALGVVTHRRGGDSTEAIALIRQALDLKPDFGDAWCNLGNVYCDLGRFAEARQAYHEALDLDQKCLLAWKGMGNVLSKMEQFEDSLVCYRKANEIFPDPITFVQLGTALKMLGRLEDAVTAFRGALQLKDDCGEAYYGLATVYEAGANLAAAREFVQRALSLMPDSSEAMQQMAGILLAAGNPDEAVGWYQRAVDAGGGTLAYSNMLFAMNSSPSRTQEEIFADSCRWEQIAPLPKELYHFPARSSGRLRIGYVSPDFKQHSVAFFFEPLLTTHNRNRFEIFCYSNVPVPDRTTERLRGLADHWQVIRNISDQDAVEMIRKDRIDILIDLAGHTADNRLGIFARRGAPVQMTWLGYPNTTGLSAIDYRITDGVADPVGPCDRLHSETLLRLPDGFLCYRPPDEAPPSSLPPCIVNGYVTFGSFNNTSKITDDVIAVWCRILRALPDSRLLLKSKALCDPEAAKGFLDRFFEHGIAAERIECVPATATIANHLALYGRIDIALDPFPYNGTTTTFEALYMGIPVVAVRGDRHAGRVGASILTLLGVKELVAESIDEYIELAISLSRDLPRLSAYHAGLREQLMQSALTDATRFTDNFEEACRAAWRSWCHTPPVSPASQHDAFERARIFATRGDFAAAREIYEAIVVEDPDNPRALHGLGVAAYKGGDSETAIRCITRAIALHPTYPIALTSLGNVFCEIGRMQESLHCFRQALSLDPGYVEIHSNILMNLQYLPDMKQEDILAESKWWAEQHARCPRYRDPFVSAGKVHDTRVRIGFVSADFRKHSVGYLVLPLFAHYDRERFDFICYNNCSALDEITERITSLVDQVKMIESMSDPDAWRLINDDNIDVLVDLSGHTAGNRLVLFSMQPAPVQVSWLGYPNTTGLSAIDYRITDGVADPVGDSDQLHTEKLLRLPEGFLCYSPPDEAPLCSSPPCIANGYVTFGSFNNTSKITDKVIAVWCRILGELPDSRLLLKSKALCDPDAVKGFLDRFLEHGIEARRIECIPATATIVDHLALYGRIDIALDTFPYNGTVTTFEALYMGIPVVAVRGDRHAGRVGASILTLLGAKELIAETNDEYIKLAVALAGDIERLALLHSTLRITLINSPLCDGDQFSRGICELFDRISLKGNRCENAAEWESRCDDAAVLLDKGDVREAELRFEVIVAESGGYPRALHGLGVIRFRMGRHEDGVALVRKAIARQSDYVDAWRNLGKMLHDLGRFLEAAECCRSVASLCPQDQDSPRLEAELLVKGGRIEQAIQVLERFAADQPEHVEAIYSLALLLQKEGLYSRADRYLQQVLDLAPDHAGVLISLGNSCLNRREFDAAENYYVSAVRVCPTSAEAHTNLGHLYTERKRFKEAVESCRRAVQLKPEFPLGWVNLACALEKSGRLSDAVGAYGTALEQDPDYYQARSSLIMLLNYLPGTTPEEIFRQSRIWNDRHAAPLAAAASFLHSRRSPGNTLRLGFVSPDFHRHPVGYFVHSFFLLYDRDGFEVYCYSDVRVEDEITEDLRDAVDGWRDVHTLDDNSLADLIHEDGIDILVDLAGHTSGNRLRVFAMKPAPVQATWAGYVGTTGLDAVDFLISDRYQSPPGAESYTSEQIIRMPNDYVCYCPPDFCSDVSSLPARTNGVITFGVFNNLAKVSPVAIRLWSEILKRVAGARLFIKNPSFEDLDVVEEYLTLFENHGVDRDRISTEGQSPPAEMLGRYAKVDIQLDTIPYSGGLTTMESLWMGVPVITLPGMLFSSRHSLSHVSNAGLCDLVASTEEEYVAIACRLAGDVEKLASLRAELRERVAASPLCDGFAFTDALQQAFTCMWDACDTASAEPGEETDDPAFQPAGTESSQQDDIVDIDAIIASIRSNAARHLESGRGLLADGQFDDAERELTDALELDAELPEALRLLARIYQKKGELQRSWDFVQQALELDPFSADVLADAGAILTATGCPSEGELKSRQALDLSPGHADAYCSLGMALAQQGRMDEAVAVLREGGARNPGHPAVHSKWIFAMQYLERFTVEEVYRVSREWDHRFGHASLQRNSAGTPPSMGNSRITIGYISPDFGMHPVGYFLKGLISNHDRNRFRVIGYSDRLREDSLAEYLKEQCDVWRVVTGIRDETVAQMMVHDGVDILIDLAGHTANNRLTLFAMRPAPVQVTWGGYVGTTGLAAMDYLISDWWESPEGADELCSERILRLPACYVTYSPPDYAPPVVENSAATAAGRTVLGCFNNVSKINEDVIDLWSEILLAMPSLDIYLKTNAFTDVKVRERYVRLFGDRGIAPERLVIEGGGTHHSMLESYRKMDIALDPFPYSGGLTTLEALWMGVPVITLPGRSFASRHTLSHLQAVGLPELVAENKDHYKRLVLALARDRDRIQSYRSSLRQRMISSPLFQYGTYTREFESALLQMLA